MTALSRRPLRTMPPEPSTSKAANIMRHLWLLAAASFLVIPAAANAQQSAIRDGLPLPVISVSGNAFFADVRPWLPAGVNIIGLLAARPSDVGAATMYDRATAHFSPETLENAQAFGANVVRFQASQPRLDPQSRHSVPDYLDREVQGVREAQQVGLIPIISMQWKKGTGVLGLSSMPDTATACAWTQIAPSFAQDRSLVYELFNELNLPAAAKGEPMNLLQRWQGEPPLRDPLGQLAYSAHPHPTLGQPAARAGWDERFGTFALTCPALVTEWIMDSRLFCQPDAAQVACNLLEYSLEHRIDFIAWAFNAPGSLVTDFQDDPTMYQDFHCGPGNGGHLQIFQARFLQRMP